MEKLLKNLNIIYENSNSSFQEELKRLKKILSKNKKVVYIGKKYPQRFFITFPKINIFCSLGYDEYTSKLTVEHNNASILLIDNELVAKNKILIMVKNYFDSKFEGGRHAKRIKYITGDE